MTVCVAIRVDECIVFAADTETTLSMRLQSGLEEKIVFQNGHKVFNLDKRLPICAMTYGTGNIGRASISQLSKQFRTKLAGDDADWAIDQNDYTIEDICKKFHKFLEETFGSITPAPAWS